MAESVEINAITFTTVHRTIIYNYTHFTFTEANFIELMSEANKAKWAALTHNKRVQIWNKLKGVIPFELNAHNDYDRYKNWIEIWDDEKEVIQYEEWNSNSQTKTDLTEAAGAIEAFLSINTEEKVCDKINTA